MTSSANPLENLNIQEIVFLSLRLCLSMIKDCPNSIQEELDLINSLSVLNEFNVTMLPLQGKKKKKML